jgi:hypothetical protein
MAILEWGLVLLLLAFLVHVILWRLHKPQSPLKALVVIFLTVPALGLIAVHVGTGAIRSLGLAGLPNLAGYLHVLLFTTSVGLAYIVAYTLLEWDSPTLTIVRKISRAGKSGLEEADIAKLAQGPSFVESRIQSLLRSGIVVDRDGRYILSRGNHLFYRSILFYSRLMQADERSG